MLFSNVIQTSESIPLSPEDIECFTHWIDEEQRADERTPELRALTGCPQNELYVISRDGQTSVMRIPPRFVDQGRKRGLRRESRFFKAI